MTPQKATNGNSPPKCSLLGSYEQMGPSDLKGASQFWKAAGTINIEGDPPACPRALFVPLRCASGLPSQRPLPVNYISNLPTYDSLIQRR